VTTAAGALLGGSIGAAVPLFNIANIGDLISATASVELYLAALVVGSATKGATYGFVACTIAPPKILARVFEGLRMVSLAGRPQMPYAE
jgi:hypothetical protein